MEIRLKDKVVAKGVIKEIEDHIASRGGSYPEWYVGIAGDPDARLFVGHGVRRKGDHWIYRDAGTSQVARFVEEFFIDLRGTDGGTGGGDTSSTSVYAYRKRPHTRE